MAEDNEKPVKKVIMVVREETDSEGKRVQLGHTNEGFSLTVDGEEKVINSLLSNSEKENKGD